MNTDLQRYIQDRVKVVSSGCWLWTGYTNRKGYGTHRAGKGKTAKAHRTAFQAFVGPIPPGLLVCHSCDTPSCCNPDHLWLGTHQDNADDMVRKGRALPPPLSTAQEQALRDDYKTGLWSQRDLAQKYGVSQSYVSNVVNRIRRRRKVIAPRL